MASRSEFILTFRLRLATVSRRTECSEAMARAHQSLKPGWLLPGGWEGGRWDGASGSCGSWAIGPLPKGSVPCNCMIKTWFFDCLLLDVGLGMQ